MSELEFRVLDFLRSGAVYSGSDLLSGLSGLANTQEVNAAVSSLYRLGYVVVGLDNSVQISSSGLSRLHQIEEYNRKEESKRRENEAKERAAEATRIQERLEDRADTERRYRGQNCVTIGAALLSFVFGIVIEHFYGIVGFLVRVFH